MHVVSEDVLIDGPSGFLEGLLDCPSDRAVESPFVSVCCHPHPQHGGAMTNKVIYTASRSLASLGMVSLRFNFRGVGKSAGSYADGVGEQDDLIAAVNWMKERYPNKRLVLAGFSFGAYISAMQATALGCDALISIAPPIGRIEFTGFKEPQTPWIVIQGEQDELVDYQLVKRWVSERKHLPNIHSMPDASHFFHGRLVQLREVITEFCLSNLSV